MVFVVLECESAIALGRPWTLRLDTVANFSVIGYKQIRAFLVYSSVQAMAFAHVITEAVWSFRIL